MSSLPGRFLHRLDDRDSPHTNRCQAREKINNYLLVICETVSVEFRSNGRVFRLRLLELVENPFKGRAIAKLVIPSFGGDTGKCGFRVENDTASFLVCLEHR